MNQGEAGVGLVVGSANASVGIGAAVAVLRAGGSALDAVVAGVRPVEANPADHSVGYGGLPNLLGQVQLDASVMEGTGLRAGAVGALSGYQDAIDLARAVMERLPHVLVTGGGASRLAAEMGLPPVELLTPEAEAVWRERLRGGGPLPAADTEKMAELVGQMARDPEKPRDHHGTVNVVARDRAGRLAVGVSTSGWAWKYPGRLGDSPIIGAGNYADDRWGAAACTGRGEMAMRCCTAHSLVTFLRFGLDLKTALRQAMLDLRHLDDPYAGEMNIVAIDAAGNHGGASTTRGKTYVYQTESMETWVEAERLHVPLAD